MRNLFPFLEWLPGYKKHYLSADLLAGFTVAIVLIPQGMAYAMIVGLPPVYGLYASLIPLVVYAFLGTSRQLAVGPVAMDSLLVAAGLATLNITGLQDYLAIVLFLTFFVGVIQLLLGLMRMGFFVNFLSRPVISGFTSAAALIIMFSQLKHLLGTDISGGTKLYQLLDSALQAVPQTNLYDLGIGILGILIIFGLKKWNKKIPGILIVVVLGIVATYMFNLDLKGLKVVGDLPRGLPTLELPLSDMNSNLEYLKKLWPIALTLALIGYLEAISIGKGIQEKNNEDTIDPNQELRALGAANIAGSFFHSFPVTASFSRSAISNEMNTRTPLAGIITAAIVLLTLLFMTSLFYYLPKAVLASIIMVSVFSLIDIAYARSLWKHRKDEFVLLITTFIITLFIGITEGILIGVLIALLLMVYRTSKPHIAVLGKIRDTDYYKNITRFDKDIEVREDLLIVRFDSQLYFGNTNYFKRRLFKLIEEKGEAIKGVILNAEAINYIDATAAQMLINVIQKLHQQNIAFFIAGAIGPTRDIIFSSGIKDVLDREFLFVRTNEAVAYFEDPSMVSIISAKLASQNKSMTNQ
ncbi:SulP family inorganic anion transporter [Muriicola sp. Z0-33]|uniref:SulP family inorganic anion transporter n=1 Tax=Muriicola sp. Z0-33 TaxID=2816957 RepID=UPI002237D654|nr:sulfate permease [Muriicola sp. Z0-33]MCW5516856.1 sulfate permease [Muriicola sp. Z0-33]